MSIHLFVVLLFAIVILDGLLAGASLDQSIVLGAGFAIAHSLSTVKAASVNVTQWRPNTDDAALAAILERFARWQALRATLQFLTFAVAVWALAANAAAIEPR